MCKFTQTTPNFYKQMSARIINYLVQLQGRVVSSESAEIQ